MSKRTKCATGRATPSAKSGTIRHVLLTAVAIATVSALLIWVLFDSRPPPNATITVWQSPTHECCTKWVSYMRAKGRPVAVNFVDDMFVVKAEFGIPDTVRSCHTAEIDDYIIEGHVPAMAITKLLVERPALKGIALPGMPAGPPGMGGAPGIYHVVGFTAEGHTRHFADVGP